MLILVKFTIGMRADAISDTRALYSVSHLSHELRPCWHGKTHVVSVYALPVFAVLAVRARVLPRQDRNGINLLGVGLVDVHKVAAVALGAGPAEEMVVAKLVSVLALLDGIHDGDVDDNGFVEAARAGVPVRLLGRDLLVLGRGRGRRRRDIDGGGAVGAGSGGPRTGLVGREGDAHRRRRRAVGNGMGVRKRRRVGTAAAGGDAAGGARGAADGGGDGVDRGALDGLVGAKEVPVETGCVRAGRFEVRGEGDAAFNDADAVAGRGVGAEQVLEEARVAALRGDAEENLLAVLVSQVPAGVVLLDTC